MTPVFGNSFSAKVSVSVALLSQGKVIPVNGPITPDGHIGVVGSVRPNVSAAYEADQRRMIISHEHDHTDDD